MPRSVADGKRTFTILTTAPAAAGTSGQLGLPTVMELNAGINASSLVLASDFAVGPTDSETFSERAVGEPFSPNAFGVSNGQCAFTPFRWFLAAGGADPVADTVFAACKTKGTTLWVAVREMNKTADTAWASMDELHYYAEVVTDNPQPLASGGWIKRRIPCQVQRQRVEQLVA